MVVDFGSPEPQRGHLSAIADDNGFAYVYVDDTATFCLSKARNVGAAAATTELLFFSDIDCYGERDLCARLVRYANDIDLGAVYDQIIKMPVYHLEEEISERFFAADVADERSSVVARGFVESLYSGKGEVAEFIDPSSNFFVCHRDFYDLIGGYNEEFRGHGSEDYEFLLRFALWSGQFPLPSAPTEDLFGPLREGFYGPKTFRGFRRLGNLISYHAEVAGLRIAHLHHPRARTTDSWYQDNDWKRTRFHDQTEPFMKERCRLLSYDWMPREKTALVLLKHDWHYEFYLPLRSAGYRLIPATVKDLQQSTEALDMIVNREVDAVAIFNPYMRSHTGIRPYFECARQSGVETIVVERGALPESWYYGPEVAYGDPSWETPAELDAYAPTDEEREIACDYVEGIRSGSHTLERNGVMARTLARYAVLGRLHPKICLVPLQIDDDLAVTRFNEKFGTYPAFRDSVLDVAERHPEVLFFVKPHPLANAELETELENVKICGPDDNIHALIELSHSVIVYNSGVGLLALLHGRRVVTLGNAFYNFEGLGRRATDFAEAVEIAFGGGEGFLERDVTHFVAWLLFRKYSFFSAESVMRDFGHRQSHEYRNLRCYQLGQPGRESRRRARLERRFSDTSYASARLGVQIDDAALHEAGLATTAALSNKLSARNNSRAATIRRKLRKLQRDPEQFFADSRNPAIRWIGRRVVG